MRTRTVKSGRYLYTPDAPHRFIRCQYCGFICDITRDTNIASSSQSFSSQEIDLEENLNGLTQMITTETDNNYILLESGTYTDVSTGCPFCGAEYTKRRT